LCFNYLKNSLENPENSVFFDQYFRSNYALNLPETEQEENALMKPIFDLVLKGQREHIIKNIDAALLVTLVCGMLNELSRVAVFEQRAVSEQEWRDTFTVIWDGIKS
ncbi:MAG: TetR/AcrR family transcriptional regulator, partial [Saprospiraceae bacterium]|nr:TetR/AcrR family transcriptional regulator [Saprospiraceae bacterium]